MMQEPKYDEIGYWSEIKLDIIREYAAAYTRILSSQSSPKFYHIYIDAFAGAGTHISKSTGQMKSIEIFLNFPVADMNRNVLWRKPDEVSRSQIKRMNRFWGDGSWR